MGEPNLSFARSKLALAQRANAVHAHLGINDISLYAINDGISPFTLSYVLKHICQSILLTFAIL